jgi:PE family
MLSAAGGDLHGIGTAVSVGNAVAAGPMTGVVPAAEEVSALSAAQFAAYAQMYQDFSAQAAVIHEQFVATLATSAASCLATEAPTRQRLVKRRTVRTRISRSYRGDQLSRAAADEPSAAAWLQCAVTSTLVKEHVTTRDIPYGADRIGLRWNKGRWRCTRYFPQPILSLGSSSRRSAAIA